MCRHDAGAGTHGPGVAAITPAGGRRTERAGNVLTVFRRGARGWQLARDANLLIKS